MFNIDDAPIIVDDPLTVPPPVIDDVAPIIVDDPLTVPPPVIDDVAPIIVDDPHTPLGFIYGANLHSDGQLPCRALGTPRPRIAWYYYKKYVTYTTHTHTPSIKIHFDHAAQLKPTSACLCLDDACFNLSTGLSY